MSFGKIHGVKIVHEKNAVDVPWILVGSAKKPRIQGKTEILAKSIQHPQHHPRKTQNWTLS
jgi:hypothetical protein